MPGSTARVKSKVPSKLTLAICAICSIDSFSKGFDQAIPALLTRTSTRPNMSSVCSTRPVTWAASVTSVGMATARCPAAVMALTWASSSLTRRAASTTCAPRRASSCAVTAPMPELAPLTMTTLPVRAWDFVLASFCSILDLTMLISTSSFAYIDGLLEIDVLDLHQPREKMVGSSEPLFRVGRAWLRYALQSVHKDVLSLEVVDSAAYLYPGTCIDDEANISRLYQMLFADMLQGVGQG